MTKPSSKEYLLGASQAELDRLRFQHTVWGYLTRSFWDRLQVKPGWRCLDVGAGPGFVAVDLSEYLGPHGEVTLLEPAENFLDYFSHEEAQKMKCNWKLIKGTVADATLPVEEYDFIFVRWVIAFVAEPEAFLKKLLASLKPGGIIAFQDYYYEGLSLYPKGGPFDGMPDVVRRYYHSVGGDPYVTGKLPAWFRKQSLTTIDYTPQARAGGHDSDLLEWAYRFFSIHLPLMAQKGLITEQEARELINDMEQHKQNEDALFFSPLLIDVAARK